MEKKIGPLFSSMGVVGCLKVNEQDKACSNEGRLRDISEWRPGGQLGGQGGRISGQIFLRSRK